MRKLEPCPQCGEQPGVHFMAGKFHVTCDTRMCTSHMILYKDTYSQAIIQWNLSLENKPLHNLRGVLP